MLIINNFEISFDTHDLNFIKKRTELFKVDDKTYTVYARFYFQNQYTMDGLLYHIEILIQDYDRPIKRIEKYCVMNMNDIVQLDIKNKEYVFNNIIVLYPNDLKAEDINIKVF